MKNASDFRSLAREALKGRWIMAVLVGLVAMILGGIDSIGPEVKLNVDLTGMDVSLTVADTPIVSTNGGVNPYIQSFLVGGAVAIVIIALIIGVFYFVIGSFVGVGYARFNLELVDHREAGFETLFSSFSNWKTTAVARFLQGIYIMLWSLLFIIPGIMASYSYAMTEFILAEHPELSASEAIGRSKEIMYGNRMRLFCLDFSFIGWNVLCAFTAGIGNLWLTPYTKAARAAFYREISGTEYKEEYGNGYYEFE